MPDVDCSFQIWPMGPSGANTLEEVGYNGRQEVIRGNPGFKYVVGNLPCLLDDLTVLENDTSVSARVPTVSLEQESAALVQNLRHTFFEAETAVFGFFERGLVKGQCFPADCEAPPFLWMRQRCLMPVKVKSKYAQSISFSAA